MPGGAQAGWNRVGARRTAFGSGAVHGQAWKRPAGKATMGLPPARDEVEVAARERWVIQYAIDGDLRYISHHDMLRLFQRALARAGLPVRYSEGFNPHPRISVPLPRPVGIASDCEYIIVEFAQMMEDDWRHQLAAQMPGGLRLGSVRRLAKGERLVPDVVRYGLRASGFDPATLRARCAEIMAADGCPVQRTLDKGAMRTVDIRPYVLALEPVADGLEFSLRVTGGGTARPSELAQLLGFDPVGINRNIRRRQVVWAPSGKHHDDRLYDEQRENLRNREAQDESTPEGHIREA